MGVRMTGSKGWTQWGGKEGGRGGKEGGGGRKEGKDEKYLPRREGSAPAKNNSRVRW